MTRKDYVRFAETLRRMRLKYKDNEDILTSIGVVEERMCTIFFEDNSNFNYTKFKEASSI